MTQSRHKPWPFVTLRSIHCQCTLIIPSEWRLASHLPEAGGTTGSIISSSRYIVVYGELKRIVWGLKSALLSAFAQAKQLLLTHAQVQYCWSKSGHPAHVYPRGRVPSWIHERVYCVVRRIDQTTNLSQEVKQSKMWSARWNNHLNMLEIVLGQYLMRIPITYAYPYHLYDLHKSQ